MQTINATANQKQGIKPRKDLLCSKCGEKESEYLLVWRKSYPDGEGVLDPAIICKDCSAQYLIRGRGFDRSPQLISFERIVKMSGQDLGIITSNNPKWYYENHLSFKFWKEKIWRIKKACVLPKEKK